MIARTTCISMALLIAIAAIFCTDGFASGNTDTKPPAPGPAWADAKQNGQMSDKGLENAENYLKSKFGKYVDKSKKAPQRKVTSKKR